MVGLGSAFLGDVRRNRLVSPSSPPTSPTPASSHSRSPSMKDLFQTTSSPTSPPQHPPAPPPPQPVQPVVIDPVLSLELRLRWLEALLLGIRQEMKSGRERDRVLMPDTKAGETLTRMAEDVQKQLNVLVESNEWLKRFMEKYEQHASLLTPPFIVSGTAPSTPPSYENMTPAELEAFLAEMEPDIRAADRDMREIEALEKKGVTAAGKLIDYEPLLLRLNALLKAHEQDLALVASIERRTAALMERHAIHVDTLSELFVAWDDTIAAAEIQVAKLEREKEDRNRRGLE